MAELISPSGDRGFEALCQKVIISDDARHRDLPTLEESDREGAEVRTPMCDERIIRVVERACGDADRAVPAGHFAVLLVAKIIAEEVQASHSVSGAGFLNVGVQS